MEKTGLLRIISEKGINVELCTFSIMEIVTIIIDWLELSRFKFNGNSESLFMGPVLLFFGSFELFKFFNSY